MKNCNGIPHPAQLAYPIADEGFTGDVTNLTDQGGSLYVNPAGGIYYDATQIIQPLPPDIEPDPIKIPPAITNEDIYQQSTGSETDPKILPPDKQPVPPTYETGNIMEWIKANPLLSGGLIVLLIYLLSSKK